MLALEMTSLGNQHCPNCIGTLSFPIAKAGLQIPRHVLSPACLCERRVGYVLLRFLLFFIPKVDMESTSQQRHAWRHTPSDHCPSQEHRCTYQGRAETVVENFHHLWCHGRVAS